MARRKNQPESVRVKCDLSERLRDIRIELHGDRGGSEMARRLGLPIRTWYNYESGVTVPAEVMLKFVELTSVEPLWLLHGQGPKFRAVLPAIGNGDSVESLLRTALQRLETKTARMPEPAIQRDGPPANGDSADDVVLIRVEGNGRERLTNASGHRYMAARREWLAARQACRVVRIEGDAMAPIISDGAYVAFSDEEDPVEDLEGSLVVAWVEGRAVVRWFGRSGRYAVLRAENAAYDPATILIDLNDTQEARRVRRVLWISTPH
jgi:phage repressor protein C with HTH and peptisase S24 domain